MISIIGIIMQIGFSGLTVFALSKIFILINSKFIRVLLVSLMLATVFSLGRVLIINY